MDIEKWINDNAVMVETGTIQGEVRMIPAIELVFLLRKHAVVPKAPPTDVLWKIDEAKPETLRQAIEMYIEECGK